MTEVLTDLLNSAYEKAYKKAIEDFTEHLKESTEVMFGQRYVDFRTVEKVAEQLKD